MCIYALATKFNNKCKIKYKDYYILKCDVSKFFASIDQNRLKEKLRRRIKDPEALKIVFDIIENEPTGLNIGSMTSQVLANEKLVLNNKTRIYRSTNNFILHFSPLNKTKCMSLYHKHDKNLLFLQALLLLDEFVLWTLSL